MVEHIKPSRVQMTNMWAQFVLLVFLFLVLLIIFCYWWFVMVDRGHGLLFALLSVGILYDQFMKRLFDLFFFSFVEFPDHHHGEVIPKYRVALITTTVPASEGRELIKKQIRAIAAVNYPHDSWILVDGEHDQFIKEYAKEYGVHYFCRLETTRWGKNKVMHWNQNKPPFKKATKAGNVNAWLEQYGEKYDIFAQLDVDYLPQKEYLTETLEYFRDPKVAWVQTPSLYRNLDNWVAASLENQARFHIPHELGFLGLAKTPIIFGSNCVFRTRAVKKIGGFQTTRAEDHLNTVVLATHGYTGIFVPEELTTGLAPADIKTYLKQQFAWAYSMFQLLLEHTPQYWERFNSKQKLIFLFTETFYPISAIVFLIYVASIFVNLLIPGIVLNISIVTLILHLIPINIFGMMVSLWAKRWFKLQGNVFSLGGILLSVLRGPIIVYALSQVLLGRQYSYMVTPKK